MLENTSPADWWGQCWTKLGTFKRYQCSIKEQVLVLVALARIHSVKKNKTKKRFFWHILSLGHFVVDCSTLVLHFCHCWYCYLICLFFCCFVDAFVAFLLYSHCKKCCLFDILSNKRTLLLYLMLKKYCLSPGIRKEMQWRSELLLGSESSETSVCEELTKEPNRGRMINIYKHLSSSRCINSFYQTKVQFLCFTLISDQFMLSSVVMGPVWDLLHHSHVSSVSIHDAGDTCGGGTWTVRDAAEEVVCFQFEVLRLIQLHFGFFDIVVYGRDQSLKWVVAPLWTDVSHHHHTQDLPIKVLFKGVNHMGFHGFLGVFVVRVPADAHHHLVDVSSAHRGPAVVDPSADVCRQMLHHRVREVRGGDAELLAASAEASDDLSSTEVWKALHACPGLGAHRAAGQDCDGRCGMTSNERHQEVSQNSQSGPRLS